MLDGLHQIFQGFDLPDGDSITLMLMVLGGFFLGSIPSGYLVGRFYGIDIRNHGSKNIGATNVHRTLGKKPAILTLILDFFKGFGATFLPLLVTTLYTDGTTLSSVSGVSAIVGHCFSPFLQLKGGKGVATSCGVFCALVPGITILALIIFGVTVKITRYVSLGSIVAAASVPVFLWVVWPDRYSDSLKLAATFAAAIIVLRHKENVKRLLTGAERKLS